MPGNSGITVRLSSTRAVSGNRPTAGTGLWRASQNKTANTYVIEITI
jgi:hypothetical protein